MSKLRVIDTFCGAGGYSEGFRQAGFEVVCGIDNWRPARETFEANGLGESMNIDMFELVDEGGYERAKQLVRDIEARHGRIDVLIGSPPCTEFSYAKKGGHGDLAKGMLLVRAHLVLAAALRPRFWLMENVPRLESAIRQESDSWDEEGFAIPLSRLGIEKQIKGVPWIGKDHLHVPYGEVHVASDFGAPQRRRRFLAGNVRPEFILAMRQDERTMDDCLSALESDVASGKRRVADPNYRYHKVPRERVRDHFYDTSLHPMYWEEMRHLKRRHIQYGRMAFPDELDRPGRTIMATFNPSSREAILMDTGKRTIYHRRRRPVFRQPTVREVACLQGFPLDFQLVAGSLSGRYKLVGNAVPCQMSYALARAVLMSFEEEGFEDKDQRKRFKETMKCLEEGKRRGKYVPIIQRQTDDPGEAPDFGDGSLRVFGSRSEKHMRRKFLSSKLENTSSIVVFENTVWTEDGKRRGGSWKSCIQKGMGKRFSQIYMDDVSVQALLYVLDADILDGGDVAGRQTVLEGVIPRTSDERAPVASILRDLMDEVDAGIPLVKPDWVEFPGYTQGHSAGHLKRISSKRLGLPPATRLQELFTADDKDSGGYISPIDLFDGLDAMMLRTVTRPGSRWVLSATAPVRCLTDEGESMYDGRISRYAVGVVESDLPLVTVIAGLLSVHVLYRMHSQDGRAREPYVASLKRAWKRLRKWCRQ